MPCNNCQSSHSPSLLVGNVQLGQSGQCWTPVFNLTSIHEVGIQGNPLGAFKSSDGGNNRIFVT